MVKITLTIKESGDVFEIEGENYARACVIMIKRILILSIFCPFLAYSNEIKPIPKEFRDKIVNSIYIIEGKDKTKYPFGIKSIQTNGNYEKSKRICEITVQNNWIRYQKLENKTNYHCFLDYLGSVYCPEKSDPKGYKNWIKNIHQ